MSKKQAILAFIGLATLSYIVIRLYNRGMDINVYLHAAKQLTSNENIYINNPFNEYLYSPFFAWLLQPFAYFGYTAGRVLWGIINFVMLIRTGKLIYQFAKPIQLSEKQSILWGITFSLVAIGPVFHNIGLGQMTIFMLWISLEGLFQILVKKRWILGSFILGAGIAIKLLPALCAFYLFIKSKYKSSIASGVFAFLCLLLPALFIGWEYNLEQLTHWADKINPSNSKYVFEQNRGTQSLNAILPTYFYDFGVLDEVPDHFKYKLTYVGEDLLKKVLLVIRIAFVLSIFLFVRYKIRWQEPLRYLWEISAVLLVTILIFPHQQKYAILYMVPAAAYILLYAFNYFKEKRQSNKKWILIPTLLLLFISMIWGRDVVGNYWVDFFDYFRIYGLLNIYYLVVLFALKPKRLVERFSGRLNDLQ